jgi:hypothetical protein
MEKIKIYPVNEDDVEEMTRHASWEGGCTICGSPVSSIHAEGSIGQHDDIETVFVCESCMETGGFDDSLERHARELEAKAKWLRSLIGKLTVMPDDEAWRAACERRTAEYRRLLRLTI